MGNFELNDCLIIVTNHHFSIYLTYDKLKLFRLNYFLVKIKKNLLVLRYKKKKFYSYT